jgi:hypothetical protein
MKSFFLRIPFLVISISLTGTLEAQNLKGLEDNNGFKKYKLGSKFVLGYGIKHKDEDGADKIVIDYAKESIGDIPVKATELYYVKDTLSKIVVRISPEYYEKLIEAMRNSFGPATQDVSNNQKINLDSSVNVNYYKDEYIWKTKRFRLHYYYSYPKTGTGGYGIKDLHLVYVLNDYGLRLNRVRAGSGAKNF